MAEVLIGSRTESNVNRFVTRNTDTGQVTGHLIVKLSGRKQIEHRTAHVYTREIVRGEEMSDAQVYDAEDGTRYMRSQRAPVNVEVAEEKSHSGEISFADEADLKVKVRNFLRTGSPNTSK